MAELLVETIWRVKVLKENKDLRAMLKDLTDKVETASTQTSGWKTALQRHKEERDVELSRYKASVEQLVSSTKNDYATEIQQLRESLEKEASSKITIFSERVEQAQTKLVQRVDILRAEVDEDNGVRGRIEQVQTNLANAIDQVHGVLETKVPSKVEEFVKEVAQRLENDFTAKISKLKSGSQTQMEKIRSQHGQELASVHYKLQEINPGEMNNLLQQAGINITKLGETLTQLQQTHKKELALHQNHCAEAVQQLRTYTDSNIAAVAQTTLQRAKESASSALEEELEALEMHIETGVSETKEQLVKSLEALKMLLEWEKDRVSTIPQMQQNQQLELYHCLMNLETGLEAMQQSIQGLVVHTQTTVPITEEADAQVQHSEEANGSEMTEADASQEMLRASQGPLERQDEQLLQTTEVQDAINGPRSTSAEHDGTTTINTAKGQPVKKRRGRLPKASKAPTMNQPVKKARGRPRKNLVNSADQPVKNVISSAMGKPANKADRKPRKSPISLTEEQLAQGVSDSAELQKDAEASASTVDQLVNESTSSTILQPVKKRTGRPPRKVIATITEHTDQEGMSPEEDHLVAAGPSLATVQPVRKGKGRARKDE